MLKQKSSSWRSFAIYPSDTDISSNGSFWTVAGVLPGGSKPQQSFSFYLGPTYKRDKGMLWNEVSCRFSDQHLYPCDIYSHTLLNIESISIGRSSNIL